MFGYVKEQISQNIGLKTTNKFQMTKTKNIYLNGLINLAQTRLGTKIVYKTDEFFAPASRILNPIL